MAAKNAEPAVLTDEQVYKTPIPESRVYVDPDLTVRVSLPYNENREEGEQFEWISVNGKSYQVRLGEPVDVPFEVFMALWESGRFKSL